MAEGDLLDSRLRRRYDAAAPGWQARMRALRYDRAYARTLRALHHLDLEPGAHVLDAGVGGGALSLALVRELGAVHVTGVDIAQGMLAEAGRTLAGTAAHYTPCRTDVRALPFSAGTFDAVVSAHLLEHFGDPSAALAELHRVLRPGSPLLVFVTRRGLAGHGVRLAWPVHPLTSRGLVGLLQLSGFRDVAPVPVKGAPWCRWLSVAALGWRG